MPALYYLLSFVCVALGFHNNTSTTAPDSHISTTAFASNISTNASDCPNIAFSSSIPDQEFYIKDKGDILVPILDYISCDGTTCSDEQKEAITIKVTEEGKNNLPSFLYLYRKDMLLTKKDEKKKLGFYPIQVTAYCYEKTANDEFTISIIVNGSTLILQIITIGSTTSLVGMCILNCKQQRLLTLQRETQISNKRIEKNLENEIGATV